MTSREQAKALAQRYLGEGGACGDTVVLDNCTIERPWGWVFFYQSREFVETGDPLRGLVGNAPLIVERDTGRVISTGTAHEIEFYIRNFEATGDPHLYPGRELELYSARPNADRLAAARLLIRRCSTAIGATKRAVDGVVSGSSFRFTAKSPEEAQEICAELGALGFEARQLPECAV